MKEIVNLNYTLSKELFNKVNYIWEVLPQIGNYILELDKTHYTEIKENVWIGDNVKISETACINGPCIIDDNTEIRRGAYIRGNVIIGKNAVIGNSTEIKNSIIFDNVQLPHFNYVGDSVLGYNAHLGAGVIVSNLKNDKSNIVIHGKEDIETGLRKLGGIIGDNVDIGCNSVVFPGSIIYPDTTIYPLTRIRGIIDANSIVKDEKTIIKKEII